MEKIESLDSKILKQENEMSRFRTIHNELKSELCRMKQAEALLQQKLSETQQKTKQNETDLQLKEDEYQVSNLIHPCIRTAYRNV